MIIYIQENQIITETSYTQEELFDIMLKGFQAVEVPDVEIPSTYKYTDFELVNGVFKLKVKKDE